MKIYALILLLSSLAGNCQGTPGTANGECVAYYYGPNCGNGGGLAGKYKPTCKGNCFKFNSFNSIAAEGDGTYGTDCVVYSDDNCQNEIGDTGNHISGGPCNNFPGANSMKCYYRC
jgi:hypothetical protein